MTCRNTYLDAWKGIAIICVVLIHTSGPIADQPLGVVLRQFINFSVSLFVAIAGFFSYGSYIKAQKNNTPFYWPRIRSLLIPYLVWSCVCILLFKRYWFYEPEMLIYHGLLIGRGISVGYYIIVLIQLTLLTKLLDVESLWSRKFILIMIGNLLMVGVMYWAVLSDFKGEAVPVPVPAIFAPTWGCAYVIGMYFRKSQKMEAMVIGRPSKKLLGMVVLLAFLFSIIEGLAFTKFPVIAISQLKISSFLFAMAIIFYILSENNKEINHMRTNWTRSFFAHLGRNSFLIYLTHMAALGVIRVMAHRMFYIDNASIEFVFISASVVIVGGLVLAYLVRMILPASWGWIFGVSSD
jgi:fucose 4-O-acetylase-like acetyltransferase